MHTYHRTAPGMALRLYPALSYILLKPECRTYHTTHVWKKEERRRKTYVHVFPSFIYFDFKQVIAQRIK